MNTAKLLVWGVAVESNNEIPTREVAEEYDVNIIAFWFRKVTRERLERTADSINCGQHPDDIYNEIEWLTKHRELEEKFNLPVLVLDAKAYREGLGKTLELE